MNAINILQDMLNLNLFDNEEIEKTVEGYIASLSLTGKDNLAQSLALWKKKIEIVEKALLENLQTSYSCKLDPENKLVSCKIVDQETGEVAMALKWKQEAQKKLDEELALSILREANNTEYDNSIFYKQKPSMLTKEEIKALLVSEGLSVAQITKCFSSVEIKAPKIVIDSLKNIIATVK